MQLQPLPCYFWTPYSYIVDNDPKNPSVYEEEGNARNPETRRERRVSVEFQLESLLKPRRLSCNPSCERSKPNSAGAKQHRVGQIVWKEHHVPEEILFVGQTSPRFNDNRLLTWLVQTLLNVTKANVCASIVEGKSFLAKARGIMTALSRSCGTNARRSSSNAD